MALSLNGSTSLSTRMAQEFQALAGRKFGESRGSVGNTQQQGLATRMQRGLEQNAQARQAGFDAAAQMRIDRSGSGAGGQGAAIAAGSLSNQTTVSLGQATTQLNDVSSASSNTSALSAQAIQSYSQIGQLNQVGSAQLATENQAPQQVLSLFR